MSHDFFLDLRGQRAPEPLLHTESCVRQLQPGDQLALELDDAEAVPEIEAWARDHRHYLSVEAVEGDIHRLRLEVGE